MFKVIYCKKLIFCHVAFGFYNIMQSIWHGFCELPKIFCIIELRTLRTQKFIQHNTCVYVCNNVTVFKHFMCIKYIKIPVKIPTSHVIPRNEKGHNISYKHLYK